METGWAAVFGVPYVTIHMDLCSCVGLSDLVNMGEHLNPGFQARLPDHFIVEGMKTAGIVVEENPFVFRKFFVEIGYKTFELLNAD
jgi:hypothetical protein